MPIVAAIVTALMGPLPGAGAVAHDLRILEAVPSLLSSLRRMAPPPFCRHETGLCPLSVSRTEKTCTAWDATRTASANQDQQQVEARRGGALFQRVRWFDGQGRVGAVGAALPPPGHRRDGDRARPALPSASEPGPLKRRADRHPCSRRSWCCRGPDRRHDPGRVRGREVDTPKVKLAPYVPWPGTLRRTVTFRAPESTPAGSSRSRGSARGLRPVGVEERLGQVGQLDAYF